MQRESDYILPARKERYLLRKYFRYFPKNLLQDTTPIESLHLIRRRHQESRLAIYLIDYQTLRNLLQDYRE